MYLGRNPVGNYARYVDWAVLLFATHHIEPESLARVWQLDDARVSMALGGGKGGNGGYLSLKLVD